MRRKFFQNKELIRQQAPHIVDLFDNAEATGDERQTRTDVINNCFTQEMGKKWKLDLQKPFFKETKIRSAL